MHPSRLRSLAKALTWRALGTLDTFLLGLLITGRADFAAGIASTEVLTKTALYYLHERGWSAVRWGVFVGPFSDLCPPLRSQWG